MPSLGNIKPTDGGGFNPVPAGKYVAEIVDHSEPTDAKSGNGQWVKVTWKILDGEYTGRQVFQTINFRHSNPIAEKIGIKELENIAFACDHDGHDFDLDACHGIPCRLTVRIEDSPNDQFGPHNVVRRVEKLPKKPAPTPAGSKPPQGPPPAAGGNAPWR